MNKCRNCEKKSFGWFIWILLHLFGRSKRGLPALSGRSSDVDEDALLVTEQKISTEENANSFITNIAIVFCYLKRPGFVSKLNTWVAYSPIRTEPARSICCYAHQKVLFLDGILTGDEKCIVYDNVWRKQCWKHACVCAEPVACSQCRCYCPFSWITKG